MKNNKGLTLIEVIISIAIISILVIVVLNMFNISIKNIINAGKRTDKVFEIKEEIDKKIIENDGTEANIKVILPGAGEQIIDGIIINSDDPNIEIKTFVPNANTP